MLNAELEFAADSYQRAKSVWKGVRQRGRRRAGAAGSERSVPFGRGRDPRPLGDLLSAAARDMGWTIELDQARLISEWHRFVGEAMAGHTRVVQIRSGALIVQCDSTTWATELRRLRGEILTRILAEFPEVGISELKFLAPGAPSWRHGGRTVRGRGPRDTYG